MVYSVFFEWLVTSVARLASLVVRLV
jgi:hypothetical protein